VVNSLSSIGFVSIVLCFPHQESHAHHIDNCFIRLTTPGFQSIARFHMYISTVINAGSLFFAYVLYLRQWNSDTEQ